jgi:hypothetical protein
LKTVPKRSQIVVIGGGLAGICAAISAARQGASVHLIESRFTLGGRIGEEIRLPIDLPNSCNSRYFREGGILNEIFLRLLKQNSEGTYAGLDRVLTSIISAEKRIELNLGIQGIEASLNSRRDAVESCLGLCFFTGKRFLYKADYFIDCSGNGSLAKLAGAPGEKGVDLAGESDALPSLIYDRSAVLLQITRHRKATPFNCPDWVKLKWEENHYEAKAEWLESLNRTLEGYHHIEWVAPKSSSPTSAYEIAWAAWDFIKNRSNLQEAAQTLAIERISPVLFSSSHFRGDGDYVLSIDDIIAGRTFDDSIALSRSPMDKGMTLLSSSRGKIALPQPFEIPLRCLYSSKIRNLLWAGEHASIRHEVAPCLSFPPTSAQMGAAVGHIAAHCISRRRQPRTLAKKGHIEEIRRSLESVDHRTGLICPSDDSDLIRSAKVSSSSTWEQKDLHSLSSRMGPLVTRCMLQFPVKGDVLEAVKITLDSPQPLDLEARLLAGASFEANIPGTCMDVSTVRKNKPGPEETLINFDHPPVTPGWHYLELRSSKPFSVLEVSNPPLGLLILYPRKNQHTSGSHSLLEYFPPLRGSFEPAPGPLLQIYPPQKFYSHAETASHPVRPSNLPNLWISKPTTFKYPEFIEFSWEQPVSISSLSLHFDPSYELPFPQFPKPFELNHLASLIKDYRIYTVAPDGKSQLLLEVSNNFLSFRHHSFESVEVQGLELEILGTNGLNRAHLFRFQAFA